MDGAECRMQSVGLLGRGLLEQETMDGGEKGQQGRSETRTELCSLGVLKFPSWLPGHKNMDRGYGLHGPAAVLQHQGAGG